jgi:hypothetical protein
MFGCACSKPAAPCSVSQPAEHCTVHFAHHFALYGKMLPVEEPQEHLHQYASRHLEGDTVSGLVGRSQIEQAHDTHSPANSKTLNRSGFVETAHGLP